MVMAMQSLDRGGTVASVLFAMFLAIVVVGIVIVGWAGMRVAVAIRMIMRMTATAGRTMVRRCLVIDLAPSQSLDRIAKAPNLLSYGIEIARLIVTDVHRSRSDGDRHIFHARHAPNGGVDLAGARGAVHAANPKSGL
jgi:hypothetical protein